MYLTYDEYEEYGGTLEETAYNSLAYEACCLLDWVTFDRLKKETELPEAVKRCVFELIKFVEAKRNIMLPQDNAVSDSETSGGSIRSMSNDGVQISYNVMSAEELYSKNRVEIRNLTRMYLHGITNSLGRQLLYRGLYPNE